MTGRRLLRVEAPHFVAGATFAKDPRGHWRCIREETAPILRWMSGRTPRFIGEWLRRKGYPFLWMDA